MLNPPNPAKIFGPSPQPPPPPGYEQCVIAALELVLSVAEGTSGVQDGGYGLLVYGTIEIAHGNWAQYVGQTYNAANPFLIGNPQDIVGGSPPIFVLAPGFPNDPRNYSSAFGRFQITSSLAQEFGFTDFSPAGQRANAAAILNSDSAVQPAMQGDLQQAAWNMWRWASMPDSPLPGNHIDMDTWKNIFKLGMLTLPECQ